jgi:hypothetical protein
MNRGLLVAETEIERLMPEREGLPMAINLYREECSYSDLMANMLREAGYSAAFRPPVDSAHHEYLHGFFTDPQSRRQIGVCRTSKTGIDVFLDLWITLFNLPDNFTGAFVHLDGICVKCESH